MDKPQLHGTPLSHFTRKIRILLVHYEIVKGLDRYPRIAARVARFAERPAVASTTPQASLAEATAAGWPENVNSRRHGI